MFEKFTAREERGQVGIGTLIVFIALVLVAAIAAGVLINTAGFLQTQAQSTGEESTEQVSTNIIFLSTVGEVHDEGDNGELDGISEFETTVQLGPGSSAVDLEETTISVFTDSGGSEEFDGVGEIEDVVGNADNILSTDAAEDEATATLVFDADAIAEEPYIEPGTTVEVVLTTPEGTQAENSFIIEDPLDPAQLDDEEQIRLD